MAIIRPREEPVKKPETAGDMKAELEELYVKRKSLESAVRKLGKSASAGDVAGALAKLQARVDMLEGRVRKLL